MCISKTQEGSTCDAEFLYCSFLLLSLRVFEIMFSFRNFFIVLVRCTICFYTVGGTGSDRMSCQYFFVYGFVLLFLIFYLHFYLLPCFGVEEDNVSVVPRGTGSVVF
jgi:hypothetical protein